MATETFEIALMLDCGRKYFSPDDIRALTDLAADSGFTSLVLHFSEDMGFRLESKTYPWLAGGDATLCVGGTRYGAPGQDGKYLTQEQLKGLADHATRKGIELIPSLDSPGHMNYAVKRYAQVTGHDIGNRFHTRGTVSPVRGSGVEPAQTEYCRGIDVSNPEAVAFAENLYREFGQLFASLGSTKFDIGGDELLGFGETPDATKGKWLQLDHWEAYARARTGNVTATAYDAFLLYMNGICELVRGLGYTSVRMWNDDVLRSSDTGWQGAVMLNPEIDVMYWTPTANRGRNTVFDYINAGHRVFNYLNSYTYYVLGTPHDGTGGYAGNTPGRILSHWSPYVFRPYADGMTAEQEPFPVPDDVGGCGMCVWCDRPSTEDAETVINNLRPRMAAMADKAKNRCIS